jgi:molecular chaperone HtpG
MSADVKQETLGFQTEVRQLLDLVVHSLYSNKEIFLRELVSNASDACDKLRFESLSNDGLYEGESDLKIEVDFSKDQNTVTIRDNGVGMSRQEVIEHIGTIAKSGTSEFFKALTGDQQKDSQLIGQFGVGFYSAFIVADKVTLTTRRAGLPAEEGVRWESDGKGEFTIQNVPRKLRGTEIVLHLKDDEKEFAESYRLRHIIHKYSDHITFPIWMPKEGDATGYETVNKATALWARPKKDITDEEYNEFYKHVGHDFEPPMARVHSKVEGKLEYTLLLYIPSRPPFDLWDRERRHGIKLYVRRVFIMDDAEQLLPAYLRFVRGVVDSNDLPLNVSREILQRHKEIDGIRSGVVNKVLNLLEDLAKDEPEKYADFWGKFGRVIKEGVVEDYANRERIAKLLRFPSTSSDTPSVSLTDYVARMKPEQKEIFYLTGDSLAAVKSSPHLEIFRKRSVEVLLLHEPIDEWLVGHLNEFDGKPLHSAAKGELDLGKLEDEGEKAKLKEAKGEFETLLNKIKELLDAQVKEVRLTHRLTESPACLVADEHDMGGHMERLLRAAGQEVTASKRILEVNPDHPLVQRLKGATEDPQFADWALILYDQALLSEGGKLDDPAAFVRRLNTMFLQMAG